jgi:epoxyqueuosine reductase
MVDYFAGSPVLRLGVEQMLRNALVVAGNSGDQRYFEQVETLTAHESPMVAEHARWAFSALKTNKVY